jgi:urate oxidase
MAVRLTGSNYGKSRIRLLRLAKQEGRHDIRELSFEIRFEGDFEAAHSKGDNRNILPDDTMKNTVYALARQHSVETVENFGLHLIEHFLTYNPQVSRVIIEAGENVWTRLKHGGKPHASAFMRVGDQKRTALLDGTRESVAVRGGIENLIVLKTTSAAFADFKKDPYTTLKEEEDRILSTVISGDWLYAEEDAEYGPLWHGVRQMLLETFVEHYSQSLQHTLYTMGEAILANFAKISEIHLSLPNKHFSLVELEPLGMDNPGTVFLPTDEPTSLVEATLRKG